MPSTQNNERCIDYFAEHSRLTHRVEELVRQVQEAEAVVRALRDELASARATAARGH